MIDIGAIVECIKNINMTYFSFSNVGIAHPEYVLLLLLGFIPLFAFSRRTVPYSSIVRIPSDPLSVWLERLWKLCGFLAITFLIIALAGAYWGSRSVDRIGRGAHIMIVLDRSTSMNDHFAKEDLELSQSKMVVARNVLQNFVSQAKEDLVGMVTFSTSPILAAPLGSDMAAVLAALKATEAGGMGFTAIARGLGMALSYFEGKPETGSRVILLVSDGGAHLDSKTQDTLRNMFHRQNASLYWIFLRSANGASLAKPEEDGHDDAYPEYHLHQYFSGIGIPYKAYEAEDPAALTQAIADISALKNQPVHYQELGTRRDLSNIFYWLTFLCTAFIFAFHLSEVKQWKAG